MKISKKLYEDIARIFYSRKERILQNMDPDRVNRELNTLYAVAFDLSEYFKNDNGRFDRQKFMKACGYENIML